MSYASIKIIVSNVLHHMQLQFITIKKNEKIEMK